MIFSPIYLDPEQQARKILAEPLEEKRGQARKTGAETSSRTMPMDFGSPTALLKKRGQARNNVVEETREKRGQAGNGKTSAGKTPPSTSIAGTSRRTIPVDYDSPAVTGSPVNQSTQGTKSESTKKTVSTAQSSHLEKTAPKIPAETAKYTASGELAANTMPPDSSFPVASADSFSYFPELHHRNYGEDRQNIRFRAHRTKESRVPFRSGRSDSSYTGPGSTTRRYTYGAVEETAVRDQSPGPGFDTGTDSRSSVPKPLETQNALARTHRSSPSFSTPGNASGTVPRSVLRGTEKRFTTKGTKDKKKNYFSRPVQNGLPGKGLPGKGDVPRSGKRFDKRLVDEKQPGKIDPENTQYTTENTFPYRKPGGKPPAYDARPEEAAKPHLKPKPGDVASSGKISGPRKTVTPQGIGEADNAAMPNSITEPHGMTRPQYMAGTHNMVKPTGLAKKGKAVQPGKPVKQPDMAMSDNKPSPDRKTIPESKPNPNHMTTPNRMVNQKPQAPAQPGKPDPENLSRAARRMARDNSSSSASRLHVSIGRIRIKGNKTPPSPRKSRRAKPLMSLQDFVNRNNRGRN